MSRLLNAILVIGAIGSGSSTLLAQRGAAVRPPPRVAALRQQVQQQFMKQVRNQLVLSPAQAPRVARVVSDFAQKRLQLDAQERELTSALHNQQRAGAAGNPDSISKLVAAINNNRVATQTTLRDEMAALAPILTPSQLGRYQVLRDRFFERIREAQMQRPAGGAPAGAPPKVPPDSVDY